MALLQMDVLWIRILMLLLLAALKSECVLRREPGLRQGSWIYHNEDGFYYTVNVESGDTIYFKCHRFDELQCGGRAKCSRQEGFSHTSDHNHGPDFHFVDIRTVRARIMERCRQRELVTFRRIYDEEITNLAVPLRIHLRYESLRESMRRARVEAYPPIPQTIGDLIDTLNDRNNRVLTMTQDGMDNIYRASVRAADGSRHIIFFSRRMLRFMRTVFIIHADGTFKSIPAVQNIGQIFVIVTTWDNHLLPLGWILMENRRTPGYIAVLQYLRDSLREFEVTRIVTDWERAQQNAWEYVFPEGDIQVQGCFWHLCRAFVTYFRCNLRLQRWLAVPIIRRLVQLCCAIPLLPRRHLIRGLQVVAAMARDQGRMVFLLMRPFFRYILTRWILNARRGRRMCFNNSEHRTNNACESHMSLLQRTLGVHHPNIFCFIEALVKLENRSYNDLHALAEGVNPSRRRRTSAVANDRRLRQLTRGLQNGPGHLNVRITRFLRYASRTFQRAFDDAADAN